MCLLASSEKIFILLGHKFSWYVSFLGLGFEDWMLEVAAAQHLEETLSDVKASVGDLISAKEFEEMAAITF